jgi:putative oxidoreductase
LSGGIAGFAGYLKALQVPAPEFFAWIGAVVEFLIGISLILGIATRYGALLCALFVIAATALAHRYWEYPPQQMQAQYTNFLKNLAILGGALLLFLTGPGRFSIDRVLSKPR